MSVKFEASKKKFDISNSNTINTGHINLSKESNFYEDEFSGNSSSKPDLSYLIEQDDDLPSGDAEQNTFDFDNRDSGNENGSEGGEQEVGNQESFMTYEQLQTKKAYYLSEIDRLTKSGVKPLVHLDMSHDLNEISGEFHRMKHFHDTQMGIKRMRNLTMIGINFLESFDEKYQFIGDMEGISMHTHANIGDFDDIFSELYNKYKDAISVGPEIRLVMTFGTMMTQFKWQKMMLKEQQRALQDTLKQSSAGNAPFSQQGIPTMRGPSSSTDSRLKNLGISEDISDFSDLSSDNDSDKVTFIKDPVDEPPKGGKKRGGGRPRKNAKK